MKITIPEISLVLLIGPSGSGKSTFAARLFLPTEVISSDTCRGLVSDDVNSLDATVDAFDLLQYLAAKRLRRGRRTVIDATNVRKEDRRVLLNLAREHHAMPVAIVFDLPKTICIERNEQRPDRNFGARVVVRQLGTMRRDLRKLKYEGIRYIYTFRSEEDVNNAEVVSQKMWTNRSEEVGPFDIIGDIHGCADELLDLIQKLGYLIETKGEPHAPGHYAVIHPEGRRLVFVGDLVDRGPRTPAALRLVMDTVTSGIGLCVPGNHDVKLFNYLKGKKVKIAHGLDASIKQLEQTPDEFKEEVREFIDSLISHIVLDDGRLVVAHAGLKEEMHGRGSGAIRQFALYGETTGEQDEFGLPVRLDWAQDYRGQALVVYGHTPVSEPYWLNRTVNIDTGCVFGGELTALRYPEKEIVSVGARQEYVESPRPITRGGAAARSAQQEADDLLYLEDISGRRQIETGLLRSVALRDQQVAPALEVMSRFSVPARLLIYLPPTMSPSETSIRDGYLEYPDQAFDYYRVQGCDQAICEEKHMGSRAVILVSKDEAACRDRFGVLSGESGVIYTRTGRPFFRDKTTEERLLSHIGDACTKSGFWERHETTWALLDAEIMPWSLKAVELLREQYAAVGAAGEVAMAHALGALEQGVGRGLEGLKALGDRSRERLSAIRDFRAAYRAYCWEVDDFAKIRLAPFHLLATEGAVHSDKNHPWHLEEIGRIVEADSLRILMNTGQKVVNLTSEEECAAATKWWEERTAAGSEGMVVKPLDFIARGKTRGKKGIMQPALKCRGKEYLRIIYGPDYDRPENLKRLRKRGLGRKSSLAMREFALGMEALQRFVDREPLRRVHECVFGVLALESDPVDPRL